MTDLSRGHFKDLSRVLLEEDSWGKLREACIELRALLEGLGGATEDPSWGRASSLPCGKALSPADATRCVEDVARTVRFVRGTRKAVAAALDRFPERPIRLLYAGCGPCAPLALPLALAFGPGELSVTLLDVHPASIDAVGRAVSALGLDGLVSATVVADASLYDPPEPPHVLVVETMQRALEKEPQVTVTRRLAPRLVPGGILVPSRIEVSACLADVAAEFDASRSRSRLELGPLLSVEVEPPSARGTGAGDEPWQLDLPSLRLPESLDGRALMVRTRVEVFGGEVLEDYDSGITYPWFPEGLQLAPGGTISGVYMTGGNPGLRLCATPPNFHSEDAGVIHRAALPS